MSNEIELKLAVDEQMPQALPHLLQKFNGQFTGSQFLANRYYDTLDYFFAQQKMGLRVRQQNDRFTLTLKTNGEVVGGLHCRPEYNLDITNGELALTQLAEKFDLAFLAEVRSDLNEIFSTDFERQTWLVDYQTSQIEVALDQGKVIAGDKQQDICEIEFELKQGELQQLLDFVREFLSLCAASVHFDSISKAKRGYRLLQHSAPKPKNWLDQWRELIHQQREQNFIQKLTALLQLEQALVEETIDFGAVYFAQDFLRSVERIGTFFNLYHHYVESAQLFDQAGQDKALGQNLAQQLLLSNQHLFEQIRDIIRLHSETKDNLSAMSTLLKLIQTPEYAQRIISLINLTAL